MKLAIVGATGLVGSTLIRVLEERFSAFTSQFSEVILAASAKSAGKQINFNKSNLKVVSLDDCLSMKPEIVIFSAGGSVSIEWAPKFAAVGTTVIDNSSAWRMDETKKLVVPEINANQLTISDKIIANPNCSTIQMVLALRDIHKNYGIKRLVISTYQSVSGTGVKALDQLEKERNGTSDWDKDMIYPHAIDKNCLPHGGDFDEDGYTTEETKLVNETRKILGDNSIQITATVVRVPVIGGHSESVNLETKKPFDLNDVISLLRNTEGVTVQNDSKNNNYPMPLYAKDKDDVFVGRIRRDFSVDNGLNLWIVADNLRKGAATNAVQIAEYLVEHHLIQN